MVTPVSNTIEQPIGPDPTANISKDVLVLIFDRLPFYDICSVRLTCKRWSAAIKEKYCKYHAERQLGPSIARRLKKTTETWKKVVDDFNKQLVVEGSFFSKCEQSAHPLLYIKTPSKEDKNFHFFIPNIDSYENEVDYFEFFKIFFGCSIDAKYHNTTRLTEPEINELLEILKIGEYIYTRKVVCEHKIMNEIIEFAINKKQIEFLDLFSAFGAKVSIEPKKMKEILNKYIQHHHLPMIQFLFRRGLFDFINYRGGEGETILHLTISREAKKINKYLISRGVPTDVLNNKGEDYLTSGKKELAAIFRRIIKNYIVLSRMRESETVVFKDSLEGYFKSEIDYNVPVDKHGNTLLHLIAKKTLHMEFKIIIDLLLIHGANPYLKNDKGETPYQIIEKQWSECKWETLEDVLKNFALHKSHKSS